MGSSIRRLHRKWTAPLGALVALAALVFTVAALPMRASADQGQIDLDLANGGAQHSATATPDSDGVIHVTATVVIDYGGGAHLTPGGTLTVGAHGDVGVTALTPSDASPLSLPVPGTWGSTSSATWTVPISFRGIADGVAHTYHVWLDINSACVDNRGASAGRDCVTGADVLLITATTPAAGGGAGGAGTPDTTAPVITVPANITTEATGPSGAAVTYVATATDNIDGSLTPTCSPVSGSTFPLGTTPVTCTATDAAGNTATSTFTVTVEDTTPPALSLPDGITEEAGGPSGNVVSFTATATDLVDGSVAVICTPASGSTFGLTTTLVTCTATDAHGNSSSGSFTVTVQDTTPPAINCGSADGAWHADNVTIDCTSHDVVSGDTSFTLSTAVGAGEETASASTGTHEVCDAAGNCATAGPVTGNKIDRKAPSLTGSRSPLGNSEGWNNGTVTVTFACTDDGSGFGTDASHSVSLAGQGAGQSAASGDCTDAVGNVAPSITVGDINIDLTKPTVSAAATTAANANGWYNHDVTVQYTCADDLSGVASCPTDEVLSATGSSSSTATATDKAGNVSDPATPVSVQIDKVAPTVTQGPITALGSLGTCTATDNEGGSGIDGTYSQTGAYTVDGSGIHYTVTCTAKDKAGNAATPSAVTYTVRAADACTFMQPITVPITVFNTGSTIPLKVICKNAAGIGFEVPGLTVTVTVTGPNTYSYTAPMGFTSDHYQNNWSTKITSKTNLPTGTYTVTANFNDGSVLNGAVGLVK